MPSYLTPYLFLDADSPPASGFAIRATTRQVARVAKIAEELFYKFLLSFPKKQRE
jgi:hypothetical protein